MVSGIPTTKDAVGSSFQVKAAYKTKAGQQAYTIVVNGAVLHVTQISAGGSHTCAVTTSGGAKCWGVNESGQLGNNSTTSSKVPVDVYGLTSGVASLAAGANYTCAVTASGGAKCWGWNVGQLGDNTFKNSSVPVDVYGLTSGVVSLATSNNSNSHTCAVTTSGGAKCWGLNSSGQLGNNGTSTSFVPVNVFGLDSGVTRITAGASFTCAVMSSGGAKCWGYNYFGQLGNNSTANSKVPVDVSGLTSGVTSITGGGYHTCALTTSGGAKCWGNNATGQLGNNSTTSSSVPVDVAP